MLAIQDIWAILVDSIDITQGDHVAKLALIGTAVGLPLAIAALYYGRKSVVQSERLEREQKANYGFTFLDREECQYALQYYVEPNCSNVDPSGEDDLRAVMPTKTSLHRFITSSFEAGAKYRHIIVLAETGMGKTSFLYSLLNANVKKRSPQRMLYIPLGRPGATAQIEAIDRQSETILLLDALDEDTEAAKDHRARIKQLMDSSAAFKRVIITCRTQFFTHDEEIPRETGILRIEPRGAGEEGVFRLYKTYILPFGSDQISVWLRKRFGLLHVFSRMRAKDLISRVPDLAVRPFLLTLIPDLIHDRQKVNNVYDLYSYMVQKWLTREEHWIERRKLEDFSRRVAVDIFTNREMRGSERMPYSELAGHFPADAPEDAWKFKSRSLLNRDGEGHFKFAHRSIMEFMFVNAFLRGDAKCLDVIWTSFMVQLFWKAIETLLVSGGEPKIRRSMLQTEDLRIAGIYSEARRLGIFDSWRTSQSELLGSRRVYSLLFLRLLLVRNTITVCDLFKNKVFAVPLALESGPYAVTSADAIRLSTSWRENRYWGVSGWRIPDVSELTELLSYEAVSRRFGPNGTRIWARSPEQRLCVVIVDKSGIAVQPVLDWKELLRVDPMKNMPPTSAIVAHVSNVDAEQFYFRSAANSDSKTFDREEE